MSHRMKKEEESQKSGLENREFLQLETNFVHDVGRKVQLEPSYQKKICLLMLKEFDQISL